MIDTSLNSIDTLQSIDDSDIQRLMTSVKGLNYTTAEFLTNYNSALKDINIKFLKENIHLYNNIVVEDLLPQGKLPYNAILTLTLKLFNDYPTICKFYQKYYTTILVDEYQDTNILGFC